MKRHRMKALVAPNGVGAGGVLECECGAEFPYERIDAALAKHQRHAAAAAKLEEGRNN